MVIGEQFFQTLPKDVQEAIVKAGQDVLELTTKEIDEKNVWATKEMDRRGTKTLQLTDEDEWKARAKKIWPQLYGMAGGKAIVDKATNIK